MKIDDLTDLQPRQLPDICRESIKFGGSAVRMVVAPRNPNGSESAQRLFRPSPVAKDPMPVVPVN